MAASRSSVACHAARGRGACARAGYDLDKLITWHLHQVVEPIRGRLPRLRKVLADAVLGRRPRRHTINRRAPLLSIPVTASEAEPHHARLSVRVWWSSACSIDYWNLIACPWTSPKFPSRAPNFGVTPSVPKDAKNEMLARVRFERFRLVLGETQSESLEFDSAGI